MFAVSNNPRPNSYDLQQWYYLQQQQQTHQEQLQQQGFVKKKGCNCGKKKNVIKHYEE
ncbi:cytochrome C oxidase subunit III [Bacillus sp. SH5-2]|uniref:cytochrome C oxidase subunit III n=1 Tax=Bacillus cereus group TaxID=86661 RepID=UPI0011F025FC|nr:cytochrome C oxidase subunit III [Bacillus sp. SH5-2]KAA0765498.1 cytochrome C oxidase subunit III [Bacillus sp. SH5-2]